MSSRDPRCKVAIVMGKVSGAAGKQQTMLVMPMDTAGVLLVRALTVFGYDDAPHGHAEAKSLIDRGLEWFGVTMTPPSG